MPTIGLRLQPRLGQAYEDSGVERRLVVLKQPMLGMEGCVQGKRMRPHVPLIKKLVIFSVGNSVGNDDRYDSGPLG